MQTQSYIATKTIHLSDVDFYVRAGDVGHHKIPENMLVIYRNQDIVKNVTRSAEAMRSMVVAGWWVLDTPEAQARVAATMAPVVALPNTPAYTAPVLPTITPEPVAVEAQAAAVTLTVTGDLNISAPAVEVQAAKVVPVAEEPKAETLMEKVMEAAKEVVEEVVEVVKEVVEKVEEVIEPQAEEVVEEDGTEGEETEEVTTPDAGGDEAAAEAPKKKAPAKGGKKSKA